MGLGCPSRYGQITKISKHYPKLGAKHIRWAKLFSRFPFTLRHFPGKQNFLADALSCLPQHDSIRTTTMQSVFTPSHLGGMVTTRSTICCPSAPSDFLERLRQAVHAEPPPPPLELSLSKTDTGFWVKDHRIYVPLSLHPDVLKMCHNSPTARHFGFVKTLHLIINRQFWWPGFHKDTAQYVAGCPICLLAKHGGGEPPGKLVPLPTPSNLV